jgi:hypothetical protein
LRSSCSPSNRNASSSCRKGRAIQYHEGTHFKIKKSVVTKK